MFFPMRLTEGVASRFGRKSKSFDVAVRAASRAGAKALVVDEHLRPVWTPRHGDLRVAVIAQSA